MTKRKPPEEHRKGGPKPKLFVETGQRFGWAVVIDPEICLVGSYPNRTARGVRLRCDCGQEYETPILNLVGATADRRGGKSCGCRDGRRGRAPNFVDRTGQRYGLLVVVGLAEPRNFNGRYHTYWLCQCDCGNEVAVSTGTLGDGRTRSCGCRCRTPRLVPGAAARNRVFKAYTGAARQRGLCWELTDEDFDRLTSGDCFYCGCKPSAVQAAPPGSVGEFAYNGIDRMDSSLGYTLSNVVTCCKICNTAKMDTPFDEFMAWIARLTEYHWFHPELTPSRRLKAAI